MVVNCKAPIIIRAIFATTLALLLGACDVDLFGTDRQPLVGRYGIYVAEGKFYLVLDNHENICGLVDGAIHKIGWSDAVILVQVEPCVEKGPPSGWRVIDVKAQKIKTIDEPTIKARPDLLGLKLMSADQAWKSGPGRRAAGGAK
jgi:hypothetical protein